MSEYLAHLLLAELVRSHLLPCCEQAPLCCRAHHLQRRMRTILSLKEILTEKRSTSLTFAKGWESVDEIADAHGSQSSALIITSAP